MVKKKRLPVVAADLQNLGNDGVAGKTLQWSVLSESPSSCAAKAGSYITSGRTSEHF